MKVLLIRPKTQGPLNEANITGIYPPLGLAYIASVLRQAGYPVQILDNQILNFNSFSFKKKIEAISPDIVLLSSTTTFWPSIAQMAKILKGISREIIIGVGGPHLSLYPTQSLLNTNIDFGVYGEGEKTILKVLRNIGARRKVKLDDVKGVIFRKNGKVIINSPREEIKNLDEVPFPAIDLLPYRRYRALFVKHPFFTMVASRACPYKCRFCCQKYLGSYRARSAENVTQEIALYVNEYKIQEIIIFDETFAVDKGRALKICELINKKELKFKWSVRTRIDLLDEKLLIALKEAGCYRLHLGIESGSQEILNKMNKELNILEIKSKIEIAKEIGFELRGYFMLAYPGETPTNIYKTIQFARALPLDWASFSIATGLPGTDIYDNALKRKYFLMDYWKEYTKGNVLPSKPYFVPEGLKEKELFSLKKKAYLEFYLRPKIILNLIKEAKNFHVFIKLLPSVYRSITKM